MLWLICDWAADLRSNERKDVDFVKKNLEKGVDDVARREGNSGTHNNVIEIKNNGLLETQLQ